MSSIPWYVWMMVLFGFYLLLNRLGIPGGLFDAADQIDDWADELLWNLYEPDQQYTMGGIFYTFYHTKLVRDNVISGQEPFIPEEYLTDFQSWYETALGAFYDHHPELFWLKPKRIVSPTPESLMQYLTGSGHTDLGAWLYWWLNDYTGWALSYPPGLEPPTG